MAKKKLNMKEKKALWIKIAEDNGVKYSTSGVEWHSHAIADYCLETLRNDIARGFYDNQK